MKRFGIFGLLLMLIVIFFIPNDNVHAEENDECSFEMSELVELDANVDENTRYMNTVSDYNTADCKINNVLQFYVRLDATFLYDGSTATCITSGASDSILNPDWQCVYLTPGRSGNTAWVNFKYVRTSTGEEVSGVVHMACNPWGVISKY